MSVTLWLDTDTEDTLELGPTLAVYGAFAEMARTVGDGWLAEYGDLAGVLTQCEDQEDADPSWLQDVARQATRMLRKHGNDLGDLAHRILAELAHSTGPVRESIQESDDAEDIDPETLAEIFYGLYGDKALEIVRRLAGLSEGWDAASHPRGKGGKFIKKGSTEAVEKAKAVVSKVVAGDPSADPKELLDHLSILTVQQIRDIGKAHGKKIPKMLREELVSAVAQLVGGKAVKKAEKETGGEKAELSYKTANTAAEWKQVFDETGGSPEAAKAYRVWYDKKESEAKAFGEKLKGPDAAAHFNEYAQHVESFRPDVGAQLRAVPALVSFINGGYSQLSAKGLTPVKVEIKGDTATFTGWDANRSAATLSLKIPEDADPARKLVYGQLSVNDGFAVPGMEHLQTQLWSNAGSRDPMQSSFILRRRAGSPPVPVQKPAEKPAPSSPQKSPNGYEFSERVRSVHAQVAALHTKAETYRNTIAENEKRQAGLYESARKREISSDVFIKQLGALVEENKSHRDKLQQSATESRRLLVKGIGGDSSLSANGSGSMDSGPNSPAGQAAGFVSSLLHGGVKANIDFIENGSQLEQRAYYDPRENHISLTTRATPATAAHEMGHWVEHNIPGARDAAREFLERRVGDEPLVKLRDKFGGGYDLWEAGRKDNFDRLFPDEMQAYYVGSAHPAGDTEIISMGVEQLYRDPAAFAAKDPEYFQFVISVLDGSGRKGGSLPREINFGEG